jgi:hypothetical protein
MCLGFLCLRWNFDVFAVEVRTVLEGMRKGLLTVSFRGTRLFFASKNFDVTVPQPWVPITNRQSFFIFSRYQVKLEDLNQFASEGFEILQMTFECIHLCMKKIWEPV